MIGTGTLRVGRVLCGYFIFRIYRKEFKDDIFLKKLYTISLYKKRTRAKTSGSSAWKPKMDFESKRKKNIIVAIVLFLSVRIVNPLYVSLLCTLPHWFTHVRDLLICCIALPIFTTITYFKQADSLQDFRPISLFIFWLSNSDLTLLVSKK